MKPFIFIITILSLLAISCGQPKITVTGIAENRKGGAVVVVEKDSISCYLAESTHWPGQINGKPVKVTGILQVDTIPPIGPGEPERQQLTGITYTIVEPEWELVNPGTLKK
jgi:hypothetical protein